MRKLIKFLLAVLVLWAVWHIGISYYHFYVFEDAVQELVQLNGGDPEAVLATEAAKLAAANGVPLKADDIAVRKEGGRVSVEASYVERVEVLPRYHYPFTHTLSVKVLLLNGIPSSPK